MCECVCVCKKVVTAVHVEGAQLDPPYQSHFCRLTGEWNQKGWKTQRRCWNLAVPQCVWESMRRLEGWKGKGRKEGEKTKETERKGTRGRKSNCFIGCNIESSRVSHLQQGQRRFCRQPCPHYANPSSKQEQWSELISSAVNTHTVYKYKAVEECFYVDGLNPSAGDRNKCTFIASL